MRIFIGVPVNKATQGVLLQWQEKALPILGDQWRMARPENLHLTLRFLGQVSHQQLTDVIKNLPGWVEAYQQMNTSSKRLALLPSYDKVRVLALEFEALVSLQMLVDSINSGLFEMGFDPPELAFLPHVSLVRHIGKPLKSFDALSGLPSIDKSVLPIEFVCIFSSEPSPKGVAYRCLFEKCFAF